MKVLGEEYFAEGNDNKKMTEEKDGARVARRESNEKMMTMMISGDARWRARKKR